MEKSLKKIVPFIIAYIVCVSLAIILLFIVSKIPQDLLTDNWADGRDTDLTQYSFLQLKAGDYSMVIDEYTDNYKIDIAYRLNEASIFNPHAYIEYLDYEYEYGRYWQGYCIILRPLLLFFNLHQIKIIYASILIITALVFIYALIKKRKFNILVLFLLSIYLCNMWMSTLCLHYFNCILIAMVTSTLFLLSDKINSKWYLTFFIVGIIVCYFDFLTYETLTLTLPLLILEIGNNGSFKQRIINIIKSSISWFFGYALMFGTKFVLYLSVSEDAREILSYKLIQRITGYADEESYTIRHSLMLPISNIRGFNLNSYKYVIPILLSAFVLFIIIKLLSKSQTMDEYLMVTIIGLIPFVRFIVIKEQSASHFYYTYYALFSTVISALYIIILTLKWMWRKL